MAEQLVEVRPAPGFRRQLAELNLRGFENHLLTSIVAEASRQLPRPRSDGYYWFVRAFGRDARLAPRRVWIGGSLQGDVLTLHEVRTQDPGA